MAASRRPRPSGAPRYPAAPHAYANESFDQAQALAQRLTDEDRRAGRAAPPYGYSRANFERAEQMIQRRRHANPSPAAPRQNDWRNRQIILPAEVDEQLFTWHGGQGTAVYALASWGMHHYVSLSQIDAALHELERDLRASRAARRSASDVRELRHLISELRNVRIFWREHSARAAGAGAPSEGYDERDYGFDADDEHEFAASGR